MIARNRIVQKNAQWARISDNLWTEDVKEGNFDNLRYFWLFWSLCLAKFAIRRFRITYSGPLWNGTITSWSNWSHCKFVLFSPYSPQYPKNRTNGSKRTQSRICFVPGGSWCTMLWMMHLGATKMCQKRPNQKYVLFRAEVRGFIYSLSLVCCTWLHRSQLFTNFRPEQKLSLIVPRLNHRFGVGEYCRLHGGSARNLQCRLSDNIGWN